MKFNQPIRFLIVFITVLLFCTACQNKKPKNPINNWKNVKSWTFKGKMAINDGNNNGSGRVEWLVSLNNIQAQFKAPLGQGSWEIFEFENSAKLHSSINGETNADNAELLISNELGWHFPWNSLQYWLRGHKTNETITSISQPKSDFMDANWHISYTQWMPSPLGLLPKKITASNPPYSVKLIIYKWDFE